MNKNQKPRVRALKLIFAYPLMAVLLLISSCGDQDQAEHLNIITIAGISGEFRSPQGIARDVQGNLFVADRSNNWIRKIAQDGTVSTFAGSGTAGFADGAGTTAMFSRPSGLAIDALGNLYVGDEGNNRVRIIAPDGMVSTFAGTGEKGFADGPASLAKFNVPSQVALDKHGNVYVTDMSNYRIRKITPQGLVSTFAGSGIRGTENGSSTEAQFLWLCGIAVDEQGSVYVGDFYGIRKISPDGVVSSFSGIGSGESVDGNISTAKFTNAAAFTIDCLGNIYVADYGNNRIRVITPEGTVGTLVKNYTTETGGDKVMYPMGITVDAYNNIYITDYVKDIVSKIESKQASPVCSDVVRE